MATSFWGEANMSDRIHEDSDAEISAIGTVHSALRGLDLDARRRVLDYVSAKLGTPIVTPEPRRPAHRDELDAVDSQVRDLPAVDEPADADGVNAVAKKWMTRSGLTVARLSNVFSIGLDEIDLIADKVPGGNKKERMRSVLLLKAIASYLGSGAARVTHEKVKEACLHYDAYDGKNFASYMKSFASEVSGGKESGYSLTPKGITAATELVKATLASGAQTK